MQQRVKLNSQAERKNQLFIRAVTNGVISERDLLLSYTVAEFYNEMSLFIEENEIQKRAFEEAKRRR